MPLAPRLVLAICCIAVLVAAGFARPAAAQTATSDAALIGWAAGPPVSAELAAEKTMMSVPSGANAMEIEHHLSSVPHRAGSPADYATALYVKQRLEQDGFTTRIVQYQVEFTGPLEQRLTLLSPHYHDFDLLEGTPGRHTKWELMAGPPFLQESGDGDVIGRVVYVNTAERTTWPNSTRAA